MDELIATLAKIGFALVTVGTFIGALEKISGLQLGVLPVLRTIRRRFGGSSTRVGDIPANFTELEWAAEQLSEKTWKQWEAEARRLGLVLGEGGSRSPSLTGVTAGIARSPSLINIGWSIDSTPDPTSERMRRLAAVWRHNQGVDELGDFFYDSPIKRIVVLGSPQAGKSAAAALLTLDLLSKRVPRTGAVPVKFSLAQWDRNLGLEAWLTQRLLDDNPPFRRKEIYGEDIVERLLKQGLVIPILDGLDELPGKREGSGDDDDRQRVIEAINDHGLSLPGLILTSQQLVYEDLDYPLRDAIVVKLGEVSAKEAHRYLHVSTLHEGHKSVARWSPLLEELDVHGDGTFARTMRSPLMLYLVPKVFHSVSSRPADLLDQKTFGTPAAIEAYLLARFVPAVFGNRPEPAQWLGYLATLLQGGPSAKASSQFGWWELSKYGRPATSRLAGIVGALAAGPAVGLAFLALFGPAFGLGAGIVAALALGILSWRNLPPKPSDAQTRPSRISSILKSGALIGIIVFVGGALARGPAFGAAAGIVFGLLIALVYGSTEPDPTLRPLDARQLLRSDRMVGLRFGLMYGIPAGITGWLLSSDVVLSVLIGLTAALAGGLLYGPIWIIAALARVDKPTERVHGVGVVAFVHLAIATVYFRSTRRLPWRIMRFLDEAHRLGVLRMVSGSYEFRHQDLQKVLAAEYAQSHPAGTG
jgi:hypothetical protein